MGVYVKGMEMPENCYQCKLRGVIDCSPLKGLSPYDAIKNCPLVEVKEPHGRLIDADALLKDEWTWFDGFGNYSGEGQLIADAPVIIEAEYKEESNEFDMGRELQRVLDEGYKQGRYDEKVETEMSLPNGEQTHALRTETHACDLISRQALMKEFSDFVRASNNSDFARTPTWNDAVSLVGSMPSAQPERKKGKWIPYLPERLRYKCSECESRYETPWHFCPNCGSYNGGENHDKG